MQVRTLALRQFLLVVVLGLLLKLALRQLQVVVEFTLLDEP